MVRELAAELIAMFAGEKRLSIAILVIVATAGSLAEFAGATRLLGGGVLLFGCVGLLIESVCRAARNGGARSSRLPARASGDPRLG